MLRYLNAVEEKCYVPDREDQVRLVFSSVKRAGQAEQIMAYVRRFVVPEELPDPRALSLLEQADQRRDFDRAFPRALEYLIDGLENSLE